MYSELLVFTNTCTLTSGPLALGRNTHSDFELPIAFTSTVKPSFDPTQGTPRNCTNRTATLSQKNKHN